MEIQGFPNYLIYDDGRIWSKAKSGRWLKSYANSRGYLNVNLSRNNKGKMWRVNRLVAIHYIPNPENKPDVDHKDHNRQNNHVSNLRWVTKQENCVNRRKRNDNTSGHKNIYYYKTQNRWVYRTDNKGKSVSKYFKNKSDAICYKYIFLLKLKSNLI
jgi:hypothetical protein